MWRIRDVSNLFRCPPFLPLLPLPPGMESELLCENLHLSPRAQVPLECLQGIVALYAPLWSPLEPFPAPAELSLRRVSVSITAQPEALQLLEVCEPLSQRQQQLRLVSVKDGLGKPLVKRCRVLSFARKDLFVQYSQDRAA